MPTPLEEMVDNLLQDIYSVTVARELLLSFAQRVRAEALKEAADMTPSEQPMSRYRPIPIPEVRDPASTPFGFVIDYLWREKGSTARRAHWPEDMCITVLPCIDLDPECEENGNVGAIKSWVFWPDDIEYSPVASDLDADDWLVTP